ncbi:MAG: hypothetical protein AAF328_03425 [Planctomycetota bacterium]
MFGTRPPNLKPRPYPRTIGRINDGLVATPWVAALTLWLAVAVKAGLGGDPTQASAVRAAMDQVSVAILAGMVLGVVPWLIVLCSSAPWPAAYSGVPRLACRDRLLCAALGAAILLGSAAATYALGLWPDWLPSEGAFWQPPRLDVPTEPAALPSPDR